MRYPVSCPWIGTIGSMNSETKIHYGLPKTSLEKNHKSKQKPLSNQSFIDDATISKYVY